MTPVVMQGSAGARRRLSRALRGWREDAEATLEQAATQLGWSASKLSRLERSEGRIRAADVLALAAIYGISEPARDEYVALASEVDPVPWWHPYRSIIPTHYEKYLELESEASRIRIFDPAFVPSMMRTETYETAMVRAEADTVTDDVIAQHLGLRIQRQARLEGSDTPLELHVVLGETGLRQNIGGPQGIHAQRQRLLELGKLSTVTLQVLPYDVSAYPGIGTAFSLVSIIDADSPHIVHLQHPAGSIYVEDPNDIQTYIDNFETLGALALSPKDSTAYIRRLMKE